MRAHLLAVCLIIATFVVGCGGSSPSSPAKPSSGESAKPAPVTAASLVDSLKVAGMPISTVTVFTAETDPNHLMGRPNGYVGKADFDKGSIELFPDAGGAKARKEYIDNIAKAAPIFGEYSYLNGPALLRLKLELTPAEAAPYAAAFAKLSTK